MPRVFFSRKKCTCLPGEHGGELASVPSGRKVITQSMSPAQPKKPAKQNKLDFDPQQHCSETQWLFAGLGSGRGKTVDRCKLSQASLYACPHALLIFQQSRMKRLFWRILTRMMHCKARSSKFHIFRGGLAAATRFKFILFRVLGSHPSKFGL